MGYPLPFKIIGMGIAIPSRKVDSSELERQFGLEAGWCLKKQGIESRYWIDGNEDATSLGTKAALSAVSDAGITKNDVDLIISASNTVDSIIPGQANLFKKSLEINSNVNAITFNAGCLNTIRVLDFAANYLCSGVYKNILIISTTVSSKGLNIENDPEEVSMVADGAAAIVVSLPEDGEKSCILASDSATYAVGVSVQSMASKSESVILSKETTKEDLSYIVDSKEMQSAGAKYNFKFLKGLYPIKNNTLDWLIPNQSSKLAKDMMKLMVKEDKILSVIKDYGNMGPVGYFFALYLAREEQKLKRGDIVMMSGIGAGISLAGVVLRY